MTKESYNFGVDTDARLHTETSGMTVKRFTLVEYLPNVIRIEDNHQKLNSHKIVDLLNELHEEKESLKIENDFLRNKLSSYKSANKVLKKRLGELKYVDRLQEENEQLKKEAEEYNEDAMSYQTLYEQQLEKYEGLLSECKHQQEQKMKFYNEIEQLKHSIKCLEADKMELQQYIKRMQGDVE